MPARKSHAAKARLVNALDHREVAMVAAPSESTMLPEFVTDAVDLIAERPAREPRKVGSFLFSAGVDPWPEIRKRLTLRQFEVFEYVYKMQMTVSDVMLIMGLQRKSVHRILNAAKRKLRKSLGKGK